MNLRSRRLALTLIAAGASLLLNLVPYGPLATFDPGRIFSLPVAILLGPWYGLLAALGGAAAYLNPDEPSKSILYVLEALALAFAARRGRSLVLAAVLFWVVVDIAFIASPVSFGSAFAAYQGPLALTYTLQRTLTLMVAVLVAKLIVLAVRRHLVHGESDGTTQHSLGKDSYDSFELVALLPVLLLAVGTSQALAARQQLDASRDLTETATSIRDHLDQYLLSHTQAVSTLAESLKLFDNDPEQRHELLERFAATYDQFSSVSAFDEFGRYLDVVPTEPSESLLRRNGVGDREFFQTAMLTGQPTVADVLMARSILRREVLPIAAPFSDANGRPAGVGIGVLDLPRMAQFLERYQSTANAAVTIIDRHSRVISTRPGPGIGARTVLADLSTDPLVRGSAAARETVYQYEGANDGGIRMVAVATLRSAKWQVFVEPTSPHF